MGGRKDGDDLGCHGGRDPLEMCVTYLFHSGETRHMSILAASNAYLMDSFERKEDEADTRSLEGIFDCFLAVVF